MTYQCIKTKITSLSDGPNTQPVIVYIYLSHLIIIYVYLWRRNAVGITTAQLDSLNVRFCACSNLACNVSKVCEGVYLRQKPRLELQELKALSLKPTSYPLYRQVIKDVKRRNTRLFLTDVSPSVLLLTTSLA